MSCGKKAAAQIVLLMAGAAMLCFGVWRGEAVDEVRDRGLACARRADEGQLLAEIGRAHV